jgi:hypothetical protein
MLVPLPTDKRRCVITRLRLSRQFLCIRSLSMGYCTWIATNTHSYAYLSFMPEDGSFLLIPSTSTVSIGMADVLGCSG